MLKKIIAGSAKNPFLVLLGIFFFIVVGFWSLKNTPLDAIPDLSDVQVIIFTEWKGRSPDIVEDQVTYPIVTTMLSAPQVKVVRAQSFFGLSFVYVIFEDGTDMYWARSRVMEYMNEAKARLPKGINPTLGPDATGVGWGFQYALVDESGNNTLADLRSFNDWNLKFWLKSVPGVSDVASIGGFVKQYQVTVDPNTLLAYKIPLKKIMMAIKRSNNDVGGRTVEMSGREYMIRGRGYIKSIKDIENIPIDVDKDGTPILIKNIARVSLGPEMRRGIAELDGKGEVVGGVVVVRFGENVLKVIERVKEKLHEVEGSLPEGTRLVTTYDRSELIEHSIENLQEKLIEESIVVSIVCIIFLFHFRSSLVAIITLPIAILLSFIPMYYMGLSSNIMSLGGIAIAIGAIIDSAIVMIENAHKKLEHAPEGYDRKAVIIEAAQEVGKPLFFALLIITVSFVPVFTLEAQEGRLFKPLAYTKTFSMFFASFLSITLVPLLMVWLIRGHITPEHKNPLNRLLIFLYQPIAKISLRFKKTTILAAILSLFLTVPAFQQLGSEFMPPLWEGTTMYMPTTVPGISITEAGKLLQTQDKLFKTIPEVETVFGKIGRAATPTDPAPLSMIETVITFKPTSEWRPGITPKKLEREMNKLIQFPGVSNGWTMPIKGRIDMLTTGIRTPIGIKVFGKELEKIQAYGEHIEAILKEVPGSRNIFAERVTGGYFLDFNIKRENAARYGLKVGDVEDIIMSAIGGMNVDMTIEGRERYPINIRYSRELRDNLESLKRVLVPTPTGQQIPMTQLADLKINTGPPMIKSEDGQLVGYVFVDIENVDIGTYIKQAKKILNEKLKLDSGYYLKWSGQYEYMERSSKRLKVVLPLTGLIIFVLLFLNFNSLTKSLIIMLSIPFSLIGAIWFLYFLEYDLSVAVWVGMIALAGVAAETGIVMIIYLDEALDELKIKTRESVRKAIMEGAVQRVRPKIMTVSAIIVGLLPIMWGSGSGADTMKRIAAPMIGGMVSSTVLTLVVIPAVYMIWKEWELKKKNKPLAEVGEDIATLMEYVKEKEEDDDENP